MDLNKTLAEHLASWGRARRGWDKAGCLSQLGRVKGRSADDVAMAWVRFCADPGAATPGAFPNLAGPHWSEKVAPPKTPSPPKPHEACRDCGRHFDACLCEGGPTISPHMPAPDVVSKVAHLKAIRDEATAEHCSCGPNCREHRPVKTDPEGA